MNNAKLQLEVVSPTTIKCGHIEWFALDTKLVGKVKVLLEENKKLKEHKYFTRQDALDEALDRINRAIEYIEDNFYEVGGEVGGSDLPYQPIQDLLDILKGENNEEKI